MKPMLVQQRFLIRESYVSAVICNKRNTISVFCVYDSRKLGLLISWVILFHIFTHWLHTCTNTTSKWSHQCLQIARGIQYRIKVMQYVQLLIIGWLNTRFIFNPFYGVSDIIIIFGLWFSAREHELSKLYGHGCIEFIPAEMNAPRKNIRVQW